MDHGRSSGAMGAKGGEPASAGKDAGPALPGVIPGALPGAGAIPGAIPGVESGGKLALTDFVDLATLRNLQEGFAELTRLNTTILDAGGQPLVPQSDPAEREASYQVLDFLLGTESGDAGQRYVAPIVVEDQELGSIEVKSDSREEAEAEWGQLRQVALKLGVAEGSVKDLVEAAESASRPSRSAAVQFLYLLANHITRLCYQEYQLRQRVEELSSLYRLSTLLSSHRDLGQLLEAAAQSAAEVLGAKAVSIRLLDTQTHEWAARAVSGLSRAFLERGPALTGRSPTLSKALAGEAAWLADVREDPRIMTRQEADREGVASVLCAGLLYQGKALGVIHWFTAEPRQFKKAELKLAVAVGQLITAAVVNARHDAQQEERQQVQRQLRLASEVQQKMLPAAVPQVPPFDIAGRYVPSYELGGDFYDLIDLGGSVGVVIGDVVGKGVAAALLMASVRAAIRAFAQEVYDLDEIITRVNVSLARDTRDKEFATLFYGVLDPRTLRLTYCNAGHEPALLLRAGEIIRLETGGMVLGVDEKQRYERGLMDLRSRDTLLFYTDGLVDAMDGQGRRFGRERLIETFRQTEGMSAANAMHHLLWAMRRYIGLNRGVDDTTLVVVRVDPNVARMGL
ncbi:MAG: SpoIIE family protein phosphatase [Phycisphaeraceae bacterium]|nr:SpoIIE family protein phosphatase [Phycisphaeraceae bacterium]